MFWLLLILVVIGVVAVLAMRATSAGRSNRRAPGEQRTTVRPDPSPAGADGPARRPDGEPIPGSEEDRHRHGKP